MDKRLKKFINIAGWAKRQTIEIRSVIETAINFKLAGHMDDIIHARRYMGLFDRDINRRMDSLLGTIMQLGMYSPNIGPFRIVLNEYDTAKLCIDNEITKPKYYNGSVSGKDLNQLDKDVCKLFECLRTSIDYMIEDFKKELEEE